MASKILFYLSLAALTFASCRTHKNANLVLSEDSNSGPTIRIEAINLSEDLSRLASNNDEILLLGYNFRDSLSSPLIMEYKIFDKDQTNHFLPLNPEKLKNTDLILFVLEIDTDRTPEKTELLIRNSSLDIMKAFSAKDRVRLKDILGDDDLLGFKKITKEELVDNFTFRISGYHKMDLYEYEFSFLNLK